MKALIISAILSLSILAGTAAEARPLFKQELPLLNRRIDSIPYPMIAVHDIGRVALTVSNYGIFGRGTYEGVPDPVTGESVPSMSYPKGYGLSYLFEGGYWVGAIVGRDTLVSTSTGADWEVREFWPHTYPSGDIIYRTTNNPEAPQFDSAVSQEDYISACYDTLAVSDYVGYDYYSRRFHRPLGIRLTQKSYAWGYDYADDFVIFDCSVGNIGVYNLKDVYIGIYLDPDIGRDFRYNSFDDICGFRKAVRSRYIAGLIDTINVAWAADNDGDPDPVSGAYMGYYSPTSAMGIRVLRTPSDSMPLNYNWWISDYNITSDWGPRQGGSLEDPFRSFDGYMGTPVGDMNKYYMMSHPEFDYDQSQTNRDQTMYGWLPPPPEADRIAYGADMRFLVSFGPIDLNPGDIAPFTFALLAGQDFHPARNFTYLGLSALWAGWIFDNPGIDTDGDGYKGKFHIYCLDSIIAGIDTLANPEDTIYDTTWYCEFGDTIYYRGDNIPDFRGAGPPPNPKIRLYPGVNEHNEGEILVRWNGRLSETRADQFSQQVDFEGYRVYSSLTGRVYDFTMLASYDVDNYDRWEYDRDLGGWTIISQPWRMQQLYQMYGNNFDPTKYYDSDHLFPYYDWRNRRQMAYFFTRHDWNQSDYRDTTRIHKVYPDQPYPSTLNLDSAAMFYPDEITADGELKYFEYEYLIKHLLPSQQYYISVTAFDQGFPAKRLNPLETDPSSNALREFAQNSSALVEEKGLPVVVYPNPYRIDGRYRERFEGWERPDLPAERTRAIHFTNLPSKCTIRIFSLDGDLVREIKHDFPKGAAGSMHESWDLISRNTMMVTSGIYYYSVESELGNQLGKFVIIY